MHDFSLKQMQKFLTELWTAEMCSWVLKANMYYGFIWRCWWLIHRSLTYMDYVHFIRTLHMCVNYTVSIQSCCYSQSISCFSATNCGGLKNWRVLPQKQKETIMKRALCLRANNIRCLWVFDQTELLAFIFQFLG